MITYVQSLVFSATTNTVVRDLTSINSKQFHISFEQCNNVEADGLTIQAPYNSPNTDGIHVTSSNVNLRNIVIGTGGSYLPAPLCALCKLVGGVIVSG